MNVPDQLYAGDTLEFRVSVDDFPPSEGWSLKYRFTPRFTAPAQAPIEIVGAVDGSEYSFLVGPSETAGWVPGAYNWARWVYKSGARQVLDDLQSRGQLQILPDPATAQQGSDNRTQAQKVLDDLKAAFADAAVRAKDSASAGLPVEFRIGDRMVKYDNLDVAMSGLLKAIRTAELDLERETDAARIARGLATRRTIRVRF